MPAQKNKTRKIKHSTQKYLDIAEIKDDVVVFKDGTLRSVLLVASVNFALKSEDEQQAIIQAYVSFLNSFEFPIQIVIQSRKLNIEPYIEKLHLIEKEQTNELLRLQTVEYRHYISELVKLGEIMNKRFYLVVPYNPLSDKGKKFFSRLWESFQPALLVRLEEERFRNRRRELMQRAEQIIGGLNSMGLQVAILDTQGLIELYYNTYNPEVAQQEKLAETKEIRLEE
ncbi:MAG: hypothetical protein V1684_00375 [bacterium]